ncbi:MAG: hypothetical protein H6817_08455 [Phycisphaerales bacterium]|nr:hypothetical protein [Phycisphaerales bacterium]
MTTTQTLDGEWQFLPVITGESAMDAQSDAPPASAQLPAPGDYEAERILVPGTWNYFPDAVGGDWGAYDVYGYPKHWQKASAGWYRRAFRLDNTLAGGRCVLCFDAVLGAASIWVNGKHVGGSTENFLPFEFDVTDFVHADGENELVVYVGPPPKQDGLWLQPCGSWFGWHCRGIWQPVRLELRPAIAITDVFAAPSVREGKLSVEVTVLAGGVGGKGQVAVAIEEAGKVVLDLGSVAVDVPERGQTVVRLERAWPDAQLWSPDDPHLYHATAKLEVAGAPPHTRQVRFGFREFWIEGTEFRLNGVPIRLFGDSWHYMGPVQQNPAYARTWYTFAKQVGVNCIRTHAMPYPPFYFELADEMGMLIIDETAVYGSAGTLAYDEDAFWENARGHMRRLVRRDRNHPSIIFWSACNETVWKGGEKIYEPLASLGAEAMKLDPSRFVSYDENDCDLGGRSPVHCGHYGTPQHWDRAWKRDKPLIIHEFSALYHGGPEAACPLGGHIVYDTFEARLYETGRDAADMFLKLRAMGAASITPWNLNWYCLKPTPVTPVEEVSAESTAGGSPLRRIGQYSVTFNYWDSDGSKDVWAANPALEHLAECYKRQRFYLTSKALGGYADNLTSVEALVLNDADATLRGTLHFVLKHPSGSCSEEIAAINLRPWSRVPVHLELRIPPSPDERPYEAALQLHDTVDDSIIYSEEWLFNSCARLHPLRGHGDVGNSSEDPKWSMPYQPRKILTVADSSYSRELLDFLELSLGDEATIRSQIANGECETLVLASKEAPRSLREWVDDPITGEWLREGGRLVALPATVKIDGTPELMPLRHRVDNPIFLCSADFTNSMRLLDRSAVYRIPGAASGFVFRRPPTGPASCPMEIGDEAEGMVYAPIVSVGCGRGHVVLYGIDFLALADSSPFAAFALMQSAHMPLPTLANREATVIGSEEYRASWLHREAGVRSKSSGEVWIVDAGDEGVLDDPRLKQSAIARHLRAGNTLYLDNLTMRTAERWSRLLDLKISCRESHRYNLDSYGLVEGVNSFDTCWVSRDDAQLITRLCLLAPDGHASATCTRWEGYQSAAEQHKVAMMYRRIAQIEADASVHDEHGFANIEHGGGRIIINQLLLREARGPFRSRALRIYSRLLDYLGVERDERVSPLAPRERRVVDADGFITDWLVLGPFEADGGQPLDRAFVDEAALGSAAISVCEGATCGGRIWQRVSSAFPQVELDGVWADAPARDRVAYAAIHVYSPQDRSVLLDAPDMIALRSGADGGTKPFLNGHNVGRFDFVRELVLDSDRVDGLPLRKGWNLLVIKLHNPSSPWRFAARLMTASGDPARDLTFALVPGENAGDA